MRQRGRRRQLGRPPSLPQAPQRHCARRRDRRGGARRRRSGLCRLEALAEHRPEAPEKRARLRRHASVGARSGRTREVQRAAGAGGRHVHEPRALVSIASRVQPPDVGGELAPLFLSDAGSGRHQQIRSEEHTSELQSLRHLVCRLLLEKKKKKKKQLKKEKQNSKNEEKPKKKNTLHPECKR